MGVLDCLVVSCQHLSSKPGFDVAVAVRIILGDKPLNGQRVPVQMLIDSLSFQSAVYHNVACGLQQVTDTKPLSLSLSFFRCHSVCRVPLKSVSTPFVSSPNSRAGTCRKPFKFAGEPRHYNAAHVCKHAHANTCRRQLRECPWASFVVRWQSRSRFLSLPRVSTLSASLSRQRTQHQIKDAVCGAVQMCLNKRSHVIFSKCNVAG